MKNSIKYNLFLVLLFTLFVTSPGAKTYQRDSEIPEDSYIIGSQMFTNSEELTDYFSGAVGTAQVIYGAASLNAEDIESLDDLVIYYHLFDKFWTNSITGNDIELEEVPETFNITHVNGKCVDDEVCGELSKKEFTVTFASHNKGGYKYTGKTEAKVIYNNPIPSAELPSASSLVRPGFKFVCWTKKDEEECFDLKTPIVEDITLETKWESLNYEISYDLNWDGADTSVDSHTCNFLDDSDFVAYQGCKFAAAPSKNKPGYTFGGWSTNKDNNADLQYFKAETDLKSLLGLEENVTLYAVWIPIEYSITYELDGGKLDSNEPTKFDVSKLNQQITLVAPTKVGYTFNKWEVIDDGGATVEENNLTITELKNIKVKALWNENEYTITYKKGYDIDDVVSTSATCKYTECKIADAITRDEYEFGGWKDAHGYLYSAGETINNVVVGDQTLTAVWYDKNTKYNITYELDGGKFTKTPQSIFTHNDEVTLPDKEGINKVGYTFDGWYSENESYSPEHKVTSISEMKNHTLYAHWIPKKYEINLYDNSGNESKGKVDSCTYGQSCNLGDNASKFTSSADQNIKLKGWSLTKDSKNIDYKDNVVIENMFSFKEEEDKLVINLYAVTEDATKHYQVKYILNGGELQTSLTDEQKTRSDNEGYKELTLPTFNDREDYHFDGWYVLNEENGTSDVKADEDGNGKMEITKDTVLVAKWTYTSHHISYVLDGGSFDGAEGATKVKAGEKLTLPKVKKDTYVFDGWYTLDKDGKTTNKVNVVEVDKMEITDDTTLVAKWKTKYSISYDLNGGTFKDGNAKYEVDKGLEEESVSITLPDVNPMEGYKFDGWYVLENGNKKDSLLTANSEYQVKGNVSFTASYSINEYNVKYYLDGGSFKDSHTDKVEKDGTLTLPEIEKEGYVLDGWYKLVDGKLDETKYTDNISNINEDLILVAVWKTKYAISYDLNGGKFTLSDSIKYTIDEGDNLTLPDVSRDNDESGVSYKLEGWYKVNTNGGLDKVDGESIDGIKENVSLVAKWEANEYNVRYYLDGGETSDELTSLVKKGENLKLPKVTKTGYTFEGWSKLVPSDKGMKLEDAANNVLEEIQVNEDLILIPKWKEEVKYSMQYYLGGGHFDVEPPKEVKASENSITINNPTREGYDFVEWQDVEGHKVDVRNNNYTVTKDMVLVAVWKRSIEITLDKEAYEATTGNDIEFTVDIKALDYEKEKVKAYFEIEEASKPNSLNYYQGESYQAINAESTKYYFNNSNETFDLKYNESFKFKINYNDEVDSEALTKTIKLKIEKEDGTLLTSKDITFTINKGE